MKKQWKRTLSKLMIMALICGSVSVQGFQLPVRAQETETSVQQPTVEEEATGGETTSVHEETTKSEETTPEPSTTEEPTTSKLPTEETTTPQETTTTEPTTPEPTTKSKKIKWNGKVVKNATMKGIDVSHHNGNIDWKKVAASDVDYAIIRCGYGINSTKQDDRKWARNVAGCEKYKIPYGVYIYSYARTTAEARNEAEHVLRMVKGHQLSFPIYYDMEENFQARLSNKKKKQIANTFLNIISQNGYECGIYANLNWWNTYLPSLAKTVEYKWVAHYNKTCGYKGTYQMWQCTSTEKVSGISGNTDLNFWYGEVRDSTYNILTTPKKVTRPAQMKIKKVSAGKKKAILQWTHQKKVVGYKVQYSRSKKFKNAGTKMTNATETTVAGLKSKKNYYFRLKAYKYKNGKRFYSKKWSKTVQKKIK